MSTLWASVDVRIYKLGLIANRPKDSPENVFRAELAKQQPFLHFWHAIGLYKDQWYFGNGFTPEGAVHNMEAAAGVSLSKSGADHVNTECLHPSTDDATVDFNADKVRCYSDEEWTKAYPQQRYLDEHGRRWIIRSVSGQPAKKVS